ncbi:MAG: phosphopyruvate hydratase [Candidatus Latescibacterota bacterium]|nr:phosphopyruvate hydratase [Candidatus Latescibacterota bacterium]
MKIQRITGRQVFDSRGNPTVEAQVVLEDGSSVIGIAPSGASTGSSEALELRDGDPDRFAGKSVFRAVDHITSEISPCLQGRQVAEQRALDELMIELDGTRNLSRLGANAVVAVSMALARAAAQSQGWQLYESLGGGAGTLLPLPEIQIIGGGLRKRIDIQDFMVIAIGAETYRQSLEMTFNVYHQTGRILQERGQLAGVADEGGFWPLFEANEDVLGVLVEAIEAAGYRPGQDVAISLDIAATDLYHDDGYRLALEDRVFSSAAFVEMIAGWVDRYPIVSLEDPLAEEDWRGWELAATKLMDRVQLIGDDLFTTNTERIRKGIDLGVANAVLIKLNQIGTVSATIDAIRCTQEAGWAPVVSARSGETEDTFIAHLAVAFDCGQLKVGSFTRSERMAKWNEVLRIEDHLGDRARFVGGEVFR